MRASAFWKNGGRLESQSARKTGSGCGSQCAGCTGTDYRLGGVSWHYGQRHHQVARQCTQVWRVFPRVEKHAGARAVQGTQFESLAEKMVGPLVYSISADAVAAAKVVY